MKSEQLVPIPTPVGQRFYDLRTRYLPAAVVGVCVIAIGLLWSQHVAAPTLVGQAEPILSNLSSHEAGMVAGLNVTRFQRVKAGDIIGHVIVANPQLIEASLAVVRAEIEAMKQDGSVNSRHQRGAMDFVQLRLDWMEQRAQLAIPRANLQLAELELQRVSDLFEDRLVSQSELDLAQASRDGLLQQTAELEKLIAAGELAFKNVDPTGDLSRVPDDPMRAIMALQEAQLRQVEAELSPIPLRASVDGVVTAIYYRSGESVTAGQPIVSISSVEPVRIVGYIRAPNLDTPQIGMKVEVRTRGGRRAVGLAQITEVGTQLEAPPLVLALSATSINTELGLPVEVSLPANLSIRPGELVDLTLVVE